MNIRVAVLNDAQNISNLVTSLAHFFLDEKTTDLPIWLSESLSKSAFEKRIEDNDYTNLVCYHGSEIVGYISIKGSEHLYHLFVNQNYHGKGIARSLWLSLLNSIQPQKTISVRSSIFAIPAYLKLGFNISGSQSVKNGLAFQPMEYCEKC